jgi:protease-4
MVNTLGLVAQPTFLRSALQTIGIQLDSVAISPFKGAYDSLTLDTISPEGLEQLDWLLDSRYAMLVEDIAAGRNMTVDAVKHMIDTAPHEDTTALENGYVDAVLHEEGLAAHLGTEHLVLWSDARKKLLREWRLRSDKYVAVLPLSGLMIPGESGGPPGDIPLPIPFIGGDRMGDRTVVRQVRNLMKDKQAAAVVLWVDSGGGAAIAADAMTAALRELAKDRPLVVYMNGVAASGGYYIATAAQWIVAQPGTITGSIGVILGKPVTGALFEKLRINRMQFTRGANAGIYSDLAPFDEQQRVQMRASIEHNYQQFIGYVAEGRRMTVEAVDAVGGGRVWTGKQALELGLVDELGDLKAAVDKARELAGLPDHAPAALMQGKVKPMVPQLAEAANPAAILRYLQENLQFISGSAQVLLPVEWKDLQT